LSVVEMRSDLRDRAAEIASSEPPAHDRHRREVLAPQLALAVRARHRRDLGDGQRLALEVRISVLASGRIERKLSGSRTRTGIVRSASRRSVATSPSQLPAI
jgi:hypothetical protein